ncbi:MAG: hypothetical protein HQL69_05135 [Magnetococcales bacterium]|nr:hypothetical protein [Magnetococcales bacterium]
MDIVFSWFFSSISLLGLWNIRVGNVVRQVTLTIMEVTMTATATGAHIVGKDSGLDYGESELLENLVDEVNSTLARLAEIDLSMNHDSENESEIAEGSHGGTVLQFLPRSEMEDLAKRVRAIESIIS